MSNTAFQSRGNLSRTLTYRPHLRASYYGLLAFAGMSGILVVGIAMAAYVNDSENIAIMVAAIGSLAPIVLLIEAHFFVRPLAFVKIKVHQEGLTMDSPEDTVEIPFQDVAAIKFSHLPYVGGWFKLVMKSGRQFRFTVVLERSEYILEMLAASRPDIVNSEDMMHYRRTAVLADHSWARVHEKLKNWLGISLKYVFLPVLLTGIMFLGIVQFAHQELPEWDSAIKIFLLILSMNLAVGFMVTFALSEFLLVTNGRDRLLANPSGLQRDLNFEKKTERIAHIAHWVLAFGLILFAITRLNA